MGKNQTVKHIFIMMLAAMLALGMSVTVPAASVKVKKVSTKSPSGSSKIVYVAKKKKVKLSTTVTVTPNKAKNKKVTYKSSNKKIATVSSKGVIKGIKTGTAKITVTSKKNKKKKDTIKVKVVKNAVTKVKLNKTKTNLSIGGTMNLKASVTAKKGSYKKVKWSTSNSKIATVKSGKVYAKKAGTVKITAKALDGSGKKATCTITVTEQKVNVQSITFVNPAKKDSTSKLIVSLSKAQVLSESNFTVKRKESQMSTQYNKTLKIEDFYTANNKDYEIELKENFDIGNVAGVTVTGISGVQTAEAVFSPAGTDDKEICLSGVVGEVIDQSIYGNNALGTCAIKVVEGNLPSGLSIKEDCIVGTYQGVLDNQKVVLQLTDERGVTSKVTCVFVVGDDTHLVAENAVRGTKSDDICVPSRQYDEYIDCYGGSGTYKAALIDNPGGYFSINNDSDGDSDILVTVNENENIAPGTYTAKVRFTDTKNSALTYDATVTFVFQNVVKVTTTYTNQEAAGNIPYLSYENLSTEDIYGTSDYDYDKKAFIAYVPAGTYNVYYRTAGKKVVLARKVAINGDASFTYTIPTIGRIKGTANKESAPGEDLRVYLYKADDMSESIDYDWADSQTNYNFSLLPAGRYVLQVRMDNKVIYTSDPIEVNNNTITNNINLK